MVHALLEVTKPIVTVFYCLGTPMYVQVDHAGEVDLYRYQEVRGDYLLYLGKNAASVEAIQTDEACE